jgi:hypothetical protein
MCGECGRRGGLEKGRDSCHQFLPPLNQNPHRSLSGRATPQPSTPSSRSYFFSCYPVYTSTPPHAFSLSARKTRWQRRLSAAALTHALHPGPVRVADESCGVFA